MIGYTYDCGESRGLQCKP